MLLSGPHWLLQMLVAGQVTYGSKIRKSWFCKSTPFGKLLCKFSDGGSRELQPGGRGGGCLYFSSLLYGVKRV